MKNVGIFIILVFIAGCVSSRPLSQDKMSLLLSSAGVDNFEYSVNSNGTSALYLDSGTIDDIGYLKSIELNILDISSTCVTDLSVLRKTKLQVISFDPYIATNGVDVIREMKTIQKINGITSSNFWANYDAGAFKPSTPVFEWPNNTCNKKTRSYIHLPTATIELLRIQKEVEQMYQNPTLR